MKRNPFGRNLFLWAAACGIGAINSLALADPALTPAYAPNYTLQNLLIDPSLYHVDQLAFNPADPTHLYAARVVFPGAGNGTIVRFDYNVGAGGVTTVSNPLTVATLEPGWGPIGMGFYNNHLIVSLSHHVDGADGIGAYDTDGRLSILTPNGDGTFGNRVDFAYGIHNLDHQIDQLRIVGNSLFVGIGTRDNAGDPSKNAAYNGTVARIADLSQTSFVDADHNGFADLNALASNYATQASDGMLRLYASGFRNPFGIHVTPAGKLWVTDNGEDTLNGGTLTPDVLYKELTAGASGTFPPGNGGNTPPLADLGDETAATGLTILPFGDAGDALVARYRNAGAEGGADFVLVDSAAGQVAVFASGFAHPIEAIVDPFGRVLLADFDIGDSSGGLYLLAPEPASLGILAAAGASILLRRRARRCA